MISALLRASALSAFLMTAASPSMAQTAAPAQLDTGAIPAPHVLMPKGDPKALVVLLSDAPGWTAKEDATAKALAEAGSFVVGIDLPTYLASLAAEEEKDAAKDPSDDCVYAVSDIEQLSQEMQRSAGSKIYSLPIIAGVGEGGAMALAIAAQTPAATVSHTVAVDPMAGIALAKELCTPALRRQSGGLTVYGLTDGPLPAPITAVFTGQANGDGRLHVESDLVPAHDDIDVEESDDDAYAALGSTLVDIIASPDSNELGLPIDVLETVPTRDTMAVIYSGDGGWRDLDKEIGEAFQKDGVPTVGVDSLRYFWSARTPAETTADLSRIIDLYSKTWGVKHVVLVGFSFGADILPTAYNLLPAAEKKRIGHIALLALSDAIDFEISVTGWLGVGGDDADGGGNTAEVKKIDPKLVQCIYGTDDDDAVCPSLKPLGIDVVAIEGGHHFDGDYVGLADRILTAVDANLHADAAANAGPNPAKP